MYLNDLSKRVKIFLIFNVFMLIISSLYANSNRFEDIKKELKFKDALPNTPKEIRDLNLTNLELKDMIDALRALNINPNLNIIKFYGKKYDKDIGYTKIYLRVITNPIIDIIYKDSRGNYLVGAIIKKDGTPVSYIEKNLINSSYQKKVVKNTKQFKNDEKFQSDEELEAEIGDDIDEFEKKEKLKKRNNLKKAYEIAMSDRYKKYRFKIKGENENGRDILMFTDPVCPACQAFETSPTFKKLVKRNKSVTIFTFPLPMHSVQNVYMRAIYMLNHCKKAKNLEEVIDYMHKSGTLDINDIALEVDENIVSKFFKDYREFWDKRLVNETPTVTDKEGDGNKELIVPLMKDSK